MATDTPIFINIGEWNGEDEELNNKVNKVADEHPTRPVFVNDVSLEN
ncbi:terminase [Staphylococcus epidermidis]|nr:terminase [Staphylococcus epidermidis]